MKKLIDSIKRRAKKAFLDFRSYAVRSTQYQTEPVGLSDDLVRKLTKRGKEKQRS